MIIMILDDEPFRVRGYVDALRAHFHKAAVYFRESAEYLVEFIHNIEAQGRTRELCLILDVMLGGEDNATSLDTILLDEHWGPFLIERDIPVLILTNKRKADVEHEVFSIAFEVPAGSGNKLRYSRSRIEVRQKHMTSDIDLPWIAERLFTQAPAQ